MRRPRGCAGLTLSELMVACSVFSMAVFAVVLIERSSRLATAKEDVRTETYRAVMLTIEHLRRELRGGMVTLVVPDRLSYRTPSLDPTGDPVVDPGGEPVWQPADPDSFSVAMNSNGQVIRSSPTEPDRILGSLGVTGKLTFLDVDPTRSDLIEVMVLARVEDPNRPERNNEFSARVKIFFDNQP